MHEYGEERTRQAMAEIAVSTRKWAQLNPKAMMRDPMSFDDYHNSRWIAWPFHLLDCCLVTDAGGGIRGHQRGPRARPAEEAGLGAGRRGVPRPLADEPDAGPDGAPGASRRRPRPSRWPGVKRSDIDLTMIYDSFTYTVLMSLESLGYCGPGEGPDFVQGPAHRPRRRLAGEHQRRRPLLHAPRHVRHLHW